MMVVVVFGSGGSSGGGGGGGDGGTVVVVEVVVVVVVALVVVVVLEPISDLQDDRRDCRGVKSGEEGREEEGGRGKGRWGRVPPHPLIL